MDSMGDAAPQAQITGTQGDGAVCQRPPERCRWCSAPLQAVEVHGHVQCGHCGINIDPCCGGAPA